MVRKPPAFDPRTYYEGYALDAKLSFQEALVLYMQDTRINQRELGDLTGYAPVSISEFLRAPGRMPENFIRTVSLTVPAMAGEYLRFRAAVDAPFYDLADQAESRAAQAAAILAKSARILLSLERAEGAIHDLRERLAQGAA